MRTVQGSGSSQAKGDVVSLHEVGNKEVPEQTVIDRDTPQCEHSPGSHSTDDVCDKNDMNQGAQIGKSQATDHDAAPTVSTADLFRLFNESVDELKGRGNTEIADAMNNVCDVVVHLMKVVTRAPSSNEALDVGELVQRESKALMDCGRSAEMLQLVRIIEPLGDLLRRVQIQANDRDISESPTFSSYIPSSPEYADESNGIGTENRDKENEENIEAERDNAVSITAIRPVEDTGNSSIVDSDTTRELMAIPEENETPMRDSASTVIFEVSGGEPGTSNRKAALRRPLCKRPLANTYEAPRPSPLPTIEESPALKRTRCCLPSVKSAPVFSMLQKELASSASCSSLSSVKSVSFDLDSSEVKIFEKAAAERVATQESSANTSNFLNVSWTEYKELFPPGSGKMPEDSPRKEVKEPERFAFVKKVGRRVSKKTLLQRLQTDFKTLDPAVAGDVSVKNWIIADSVLEMMNEKCFLDPIHNQGSLVSRVHYPQIDPQDILDSVRELNALPSGLAVYLAIGYDWANEREPVMKFDNIYRHIVSTLKKMLLAGYTSAVQLQAKTAQEYDLHMETKKGAKKRCLQRGGRMWLPPPRLFLLTIPSDDGDETTQARCDAINEMMRSLTVGSYDGSSSGDEQTDLDTEDPYIAAEQVHPELLDWGEMCKEEGVDTRRERIKVLMEHLRLERGVLMKATNR